MELSLSVSLPVRNAPGTLSSTVAQLMEILPELVSDFELIVVDNASTDSTAEVAHELSLQYPQIRVTRLSEPVGYEQIVRRSTRDAIGDVFLFADKGCELDPLQLHKLWQAVMHHDVVLGRRGGSSIRRNGAASSAWRWTRRRVRWNEPGFQMMRRSAVIDWVKSPLGAHRADWIAALEDKGFRLAEVPLFPIGARQPGKAKKRTSVASTRDAGYHARADAGSKGHGMKLGPRYLVGRIKAFAFGE